MSNELTLVVRDIGGTGIAQRSDWYINATDLCGAAGKLFANYRRNESTEEFLERLSLTMRISIVKLVESREGRFGGTWVHPKVAIHLGQWLSPEFAVRVTDWVFDWMELGRTPVIHAPQPMGAYIRRSCLNAQSVPHGHFSVLGQVADLIVGRIESMGYVIPDDYWPDISVGLTFCEHLRGIGFDTDALPSYPHYNPKTGRTDPANAYPDAMLPMARKWIMEVWLPKYAPLYFKRKKNPVALEYSIKLLDKQGIPRIGPGKEASRRKRIAAA
jgi:hypothetical protein